MKELFYKYIRLIKLSFGLFKKVEIHNFLETKPVSDHFGTDRGLPIDRYYIEKFLFLNGDKIKGRVIEIAEDTYSKKFVSPEEYENSTFDVFTYNSKQVANTLTGDLTNSDSLPENRYDCFICTQTLNFIFEVEKAVEGTYKLLKPGGVLLATVAGISQISRYDMDRWGDYWRFTDLSIRKIFESVFGKDKVELVTYGNVAAATAFLYGVSVEDLPDPKILEVIDPNYQMIIGIVARK